MAPAGMSAGAVAIVTLGCGRNEVDSDNVAGLLVRGGYRIVEEADAADCVLVNTCTFIAPAREESIEVILDACDVQVPVVVMGCMAERYGAELSAALPEAAAVVGFGSYPRLPDIVAAALRGERASPGNHGGGSDRRRGLPLLAAAPTGPHAPPTAAFPVRTQPKGPWAYLKIAGGCDRVCTFCAIPSFRGRFSSRPLTELEAETRWLVARGVREIVCVSENTTSWGKDLDAGRRHQVDLIEMFDRIDGLELVRLMYLQPAEIIPELLDAMAASRAVAGYYDLSLQHAAPGVLDRMARSGSPERFLELIEGIRRRDPGAVFRSSFITGFPGETDDDVQILADFVDAAGIDWAGVFTFSAEEGTAAADMELQVDADEARRRADEIREVAEAVAADRARRFVGCDLEILVTDTEVDGSGRSVTIGRSYREAPETDGEVRVQGVGVPVGRMAPVRIVDVDGVDLLAEPLVPAPPPGLRP